ncbi:DivIVA domain-containing protein [Haloactinopolyspora alba]|uniref:DivIVA domain-containing protein n=1 Tax=Haloactinopolyspora alba TaxID=648780 RepID=A0A2P8DVC5_9ACTN|nr:DivIVA domain-containing protein [Haloactinopolyspora alba]PSL01170.1 DivIVA domain-containing protein [Haloactinopolyspora alba]
MAVSREPEFRTTRMREGYDLDAVDDFVDLVIDALDGRSSGRGVTPEQVEGEEFKVVRMREGYVMDDVDDWLDAAAAELRRMRKAAAQQGPAQQAPAQQPPAQPQAQSYGATQAPAAQQPQPTQQAPAVTQHAAAAGTQHGQPGAQYGQAPAAPASPQPPMPSPPVAPSPAPPPVGGYPGMGAPAQPGPGVSGQPGAGYPQYYEPDQGPATGYGQAYGQAPATSHGSVPGTSHGSSPGVAKNTVPGYDPLTDSAVNELDPVLRALDPSFAAADQHQSAHGQVPVDDTGVDDQPLSPSTTPSTGLHHVEVWVRDLDLATRSFGWLFERLGWTLFQAWEHGRSWQAPGGGPYVVVETSPDMSWVAYDRKAPGLNHLALAVPEQWMVDRIVSEAPAYGWRLMFADRHPHAGGPHHYAAYMENDEGFEVEVVAP